MNSKDDKTYKKDGLKKELLSFVIFPIIIFYLIDIYYLLNYNDGNVLYSKTGFLIGCIICFCLYYICYSITKKTWKATLIIAVLLFILGVTNQVKIAYTSEPVYISDILYLNNTDELLGIVEGTMYDSLKSYIPATIIYLITSSLIIILSYKNNINLSLSIKKRILISASCIIVLTILFMPLNCTTRLFSKAFLQKDYASTTTNLQYYSRYGIIAGMYGQMLENRIEKPEDYNEDEIEDRLLDLNAQYIQDKSFGKPNIIVVFSESFWDIDELEEVKFNKEVAPNFKKLKEEGIFFNMISPSYGGVSANVEFEFLTGANTVFFSKSYVPYMQLYRNKSYYNRPSIISELKNNGYRTKIVTCASEKLFDCKKFYNYLGVDETQYLAKVDKSEIKGQYISDEAVTNRIIDAFNSKPKDEKLFYMTLTMQAHMPYLISKYENYDVKVESSNLSKEMEDTLTSYAQGIYDADKQLNRLYEYIKTLQEPTIIVFYGDHLPYLSTAKGEDIMEKLEYFNTQDKLKNYYRKYNTQSLILANFNIEENEINYIGPDLLSVYILNKMDINLSNYYKWLNNIKDTIGAQNHTVTVDNKGNLYYTNQLKGNIKQIYGIRKKVQYKYFIE